MKNKKILIPTIVIISIIVCTLAYFLISKSLTNNKLKKELTTIVTTFYDNEFVKINPNFINQWEYLRTDLEDLKELKKDITLFEKHDCNLNNTYVDIKKSNDGYTTEVHLDCKK